MTVPNYTRTEPWLLLLYLVLLAIGCAFAGLFLTLALIGLIYGKALAWSIMAMHNNGDPNFIPAFRLFLGLGNTLFTFFVSAILFARFISGEAERYLRRQTYVPAILFLITLVFIICFLPVMDITAYFNQKMTLPPFLHGVEQWIRESEAQNGAIVKMVLNMRGIGDLLISIFIVGFLPAISEEFFFRGCMQTIFMRWTKNVHASVWITAFLFSFFHFEFLGFVPRFLLGGVLGYFFAWSGSIWPSVFLHFLNNSFSVLAIYLHDHNLSKIDPDSNTPMLSHGWMYLIFLVLSVLLALYFRKITIDKQLETEDGEELD